LEVSKLLIWWLFARRAWEGACTRGEYVVVVCVCEKMRAWFACEFTRERESSRIYKDRSDEANDEDAREGVVLAAEKNRPERTRSKKQKNSIFFAVRGGKEDR
jgi:hypothetical protein